MVSLIALVVASINFYKSAETQNKTNKNQLTYNCLDRWRNEKVYQYYCDVGEILSDLRKGYPNVINGDLPYFKDDTESLIKVTELIYNYLNDDQNIVILDKFYYISIVMKDIAIMSNNNLLNEDIASDFFYEDFEDIWEYFRLYWLVNEEFSDTYTQVKNMMKRWIKKQTQPKVLYDLDEEKIKDEFNKLL